MSECLAITMIPLKKLLVSSSKMVFVNFIKVYIYKNENTTNNVYYYLRFWTLNNVMVLLDIYKKIFA